MTTHVALLRGINVGGKNLIRMADLKACFEDDGFEQVATYIQSGNVVFAAERSSLTALTDRIERMLAARFDYEASVVLRSRRQMRTIVDRAPAGFGEDPVRYRYDVIFLKAPLTAATAMKSVLTREGVDQAHAGTGVLYFSILDQPGHAESDQPDRVDARLQGHDDPQLEHDHAAPEDAGVRLSVDVNACRAWRRREGPGPGGSST